MPFDYAATNQNTNAPYIYIEQTEITQFRLKKYADKNHTPKLANTKY